MDESDVFKDDDDDKIMTSDMLKSGSSMKTIHSQVEKNWSINLGISLENFIN